MILTLLSKCRNEPSIYKIWNYFIFYKILQITKKIQNNNNEPSRKNDTFHWCLKMTWA